MEYSPIDQWFSYERMYAVNDNNTFYNIFKQKNTKCCNPKVAMENCTILKDLGDFKAGTKVSLIVFFASSVVVIYPNVKISLSRFENERPSSCALLSDWGILFEEKVYFRTNFQIDNKETKAILGYHGFVYGKCLSYKNKGFLIKKAKKNENFAFFDDYNPSQFKMNYKNSTIKFGDDRVVNFKVMFEEK